MRKKGGKKADIFINMEIIPKAAILTHCEEKIKKYQL